MDTSPADASTFRQDLFKACTVPRPIGWLSTVSPDGVANLAPYSQWQNLTWDPPMVMFAANQSVLGGRKDTVRNTEATGWFVWNMATWDLREAMNASSATVNPEVDEFDLAGLAKAPCRLIKPLRVAESPVCLECRLFKIVGLPDDAGAEPYAVIIGRVVGIHIDDRFIQDGRVDTAAMRPIARMGYSEYATVTEAWRMRRPA